MERGTKRKAALTAASPVAVERPAKRRRTPVKEAPPKRSADSDSSDEIRDVGLKFIARLRSAKDSNGNLICTDFLTLPPRSHFPDYYIHTALPLAIDTIESKIKKDKYPSISAIESDAKRMVQNAKDYNEPGSDIYLSAERMRKAIFGFMKIHNPAYTRDKNYNPTATAIPESVFDDEPQKPAAGKIRLKSAKADVAAPPPAEEVKAAAPPAEPTAPADAVLSPDEEGYSESFEGKSFQQAQEQIAQEMILHTSEDGSLYDFQPFLNLPSRKLVEYYRMIKEPLSLNGVLKKVRGISGARGHEKTTSQSEFRSWDAFEAEVARIWLNAQTFNEDESEIYVLSQELETHFKERLAEAKKHVAEPAQPTLKLNMVKPSAASSIKLRLGQKASPAPTAPTATSRTSDTPNVAAKEAATVDTKPAVNGQVQPPATTPRAPSQPAAKAATPAVDEVKSESQAPSSPAPTTNQQPPQPATTHATMPASSRMVNGASHANPHIFSSHHVPTSATGFDNKFRQEGKDATSALLSSLTIVSHPSLQLPPSTHHLHLKVPASDKLTQQNILLNLPPSHTHLQLFPSVSATVANNRNRPYRLFVTANGTRLNSNLNARIPPRAHKAAQSNGTQTPDTLTPATPESEQGPTLGYDVRLLTGMNRIEVECVAVAEGALGAGTPAGKGGLEMERFGVFAHLLRG